MKRFGFIFVVALLILKTFTNAENSTVKSTNSTTQAPAHSHNVSDHQHSQDHSHDHHDNHDHHHGHKCKHYSSSSSSSSESKEILSSTTIKTTTSGIVRAKRQLPTPLPNGVTQSLASLLGIGNQQPVPIGQTGQQFPQGPPPSGQQFPSLGSPQGPPQSGVTPFGGALVSALPNAAQGIALGGPAPIGSSGSASHPGPIKFPAAPPSG